MQRFLNKILLKEATFIFARKFKDYENCMMMPGGSRDVPFANNRFPASKLDTEDQGRPLSICR